MPSPSSELSSESCMRFRSVARVGQKSSFWLPCALPAPSPPPSRPFESEAVTDPGEGDVGRRIPGLVAPELVLRIDGEGDSAAERAFGSTSASRTDLREESGGAIIAPEPVLVPFARGALPPFTCAPPESHEGVARPVVAVVVVVEGTARVLLAGVDVPEFEAYERETLTFSLPSAISTMLISDSSPLCTSERRGGVGIARGCC